jgi:ribonucleoside-triphosphate reductase
MKYIEKRDGTLVPFNKEKIIRAINAAFIEVDGCLYETDTATDIANHIEDLLNTKKRYTVEMIQDEVEDQLM